MEKNKADMKWLAFIEGELSNAAFYFSPFGNVNDDTKCTVNGTLGKGSQNTWQPWLVIPSSIILLFIEPSNNLSLV